MTAVNRKPAWYFYPAWVAVSVLSMLLAWLCATTILRWIVNLVGGTVQVGGQRYITEDHFLAYILLPVLGLLMGLFQYALLRGYLPRMGVWILATLAGWILPFVLLGAVGLALPTLDFSSTVVNVLSLLLFGLMLGLAPWYVLRGRVRGASLWLWASALGWAAAILITGGTISTTLDVVAVVLIPPLAGCVAWWLMFEGPGARQLAPA